VGQRVRILSIVLVVSGVGILFGTSFGRRAGETSEPGPPSAIPGTQGRVRVEVLNGSGLAGVARDATRILRDSGFDVVHYGNAGTYSVDPSVVMDRVGEMETARSVAEALGIPQFRSEPDSSRFVEVSVRLGPDWTPPQLTAEENQDPAHWWDLRRLFRRKTTSESENP